MIAQIAIPVLIVITTLCTFLMLKWAHEEYATGKVNFGFLLFNYAIWGGVCVACIVKFAVALTDI